MELQTGGGGGGAGWKEREDIERKIFLLNTRSPAETTLNKAVSRLLHYGTENSPLHALH